MSSLASTLGVVLFAAAGVSAPSGPPEPATAPAPSTPAQPPNVIVVMLDDFGTDKLQFYRHGSAWGETAPKTPVINWLARNGTVFWNACASPLCSPSRAMLQTGRHAFRTGMFSLAEFGGYDLPDKEILIPEMLKCGNPSFATGLFGKWHLVDSTSSGTGQLRDCQNQPFGPSIPLDDCFHPIRNGYDVFVGHLSNTCDNEAWDRIDTRVGCASPVEPTWIGRKVRMDAREWIDSIPSTQPWFASVNLYPPHAPYTIPPHFTEVPPPPGFNPTPLPPGFVAPPCFPGFVACTQLINPPGTPNTPSVQATMADVRIAYRANVEAIDYEIGQLLFTASGLLPNTYVILVGDNGTQNEAFQSDDDANNYGPLAAPFPQKHAKRSPYQGGVRVPMIVVGPGVATGICYAPVSLVDVWRTVADLVGITPTLGGTDSVSFATYLSNPGQWPPPASARQFTYTEGGDTNGVYWNRLTNQWEDANGALAAPPAGYRRTVMDWTGLKYHRGGTLPLINPCSPPAATAFLAHAPCDSPTGAWEECYQIYTYPPGGAYLRVDENEINMVTPTPSVLDPLRCTMNILSGP